MKLADNAIATYNLIHQLSIAPQSFYRSYLSPSTYWRALNQAANIYGNSQPWMIPLTPALARRWLISRQQSPDP